MFSMEDKVRGSPRTTALHAIVLCLTSKCILSNYCIIIAFLPVPLTFLLWCMYQMEGSNTQTYQGKILLAIVFQSALSSISCFQGKFLTVMLCVLVNKLILFLRGTFLSRCQESVKLGSQEHGNATLQLQAQVLSFLPVAVQAVLSSFCGPGGAAGLWQGQH